MKNAHTSLFYSGLALLIVPATIAHAIVAPAMTPPDITIFDQKPADGSVLVKYAYIPKDGYIVIYGAGSDGKAADDPLGSVALKAGDHRDVKIKLSEPPASKTTLWAAMYEDGDNDQKFDKGKDKPVWSASLPAQNRFSIQ